MKRLRCKHCDRILKTEDIFDDKLSKIIGRQKKVHRRLVTEGPSRPGAFCSRTFMKECGPVEEEEISDYYECVEEFVKQKI